MKAKIKNYLTLNNIIDLSVDIGLLLFDVFGAPIMIPIRIGKWLLKMGIKHGRKIGINYFTIKFEQRRTAGY
jgi:hypothetical protein